MQLKPTAFAWPGRSVIGEPRRAGGREAGDDLEVLGHDRRGDAAVVAGDERERVGAGVAAGGGVVERRRRAAGDAAVGGRALAREDHRVAVGVAADGAEVERGRPPRRDALGAERVVVAGRRAVVGGVDRDRDGLRVAVAGDVARLQRERVGAGGAGVRGVGDHADLVERAERALRRGGVGVGLRVVLGAPAGELEVDAAAGPHADRDRALEAGGRLGGVDVDLDLAGRRAAVAVGDRERDVVLAEPVAVGGVDDAVVARRARAVAGGGAGRVGEVVVVGVGAVGEQRAAGGPGRRPAGRRRCRSAGS